MIVMRRLGGAIQCPVEGESKPLSEGNRYIRSSRLSPISAEPSFCNSKAHNSIGSHLIFRSTNCLDLRSAE